MAGMFGAKNLTQVQEDRIGALWNLHFMRPQRPYGKDPVMVSVRPQEKGRSNG